MTLRLHVHVKFFFYLKLYGDLNNERTEIDSKLAFGFLKMGTVCIPIFTSINL